MPGTAARRAHEDGFLSHARRASGRPSTARVTRLLELSRKHLKIDPPRALALATRAETRARALEEPRLVAQSLRAKANALWISGQPRLAVDLHEHALRVFEERGDDTEVARTLNASIQPLILIGRYDEALRAGDRARRLFQAQHDNLRLAWLEINIGNLYHRQDRLEEALACYDRAYESLTVLQDREGLVSTLHNRAVTFIAMGDFQGALAGYSAARALASARGLTQAVAQADYNVAWLYFMRGEYSRAIELLKTAHEASRRSGDSYHAALCHLDLSEIYLELNLSEEARDLAEQANRQFEQLSIGLEAARSLANIAIAHGQEAKSNRALELFGRAREMFVREGNRVWPSLIDLYRALVFFHEGRLTDARRLTVAALDFLAGSRLPTKAALCHVLLADIGLRCHDLETARSECDRALGRLVGVHAPALHYRAQLLLARIHRAAGHRALAYEAGQAARHAVETLRRGLRDDELKITFLKDKTAVYEHLVEWSLEGEAPPPDAVREAFFYTEQAKSRSLVDLLVHPAPRVIRQEAAESSLARSIRELREELSWYYHLLDREELQGADAAPGRVERLRTQASAREQQLVRMLRELPADSIEAELDTPTTFSLDMIRASLPAETALLEYFQVGDRFLLWLVSAEELKVFPLSTASQVNHHLHLLQFQLAKARLKGEYLEIFRDSLLQATRAHLQDLHRELLAPVWPAIRGRHLLIVPHGTLHHLPFHALFDGHQYVIDSCTVSYAPSASIYTLCDRQPRSDDGIALVLGVGDERAPMTESEAREVASVLPHSELYLGTDATSDVLRARGPHSRTIHIASHGYFRPDNPMFSAIRLGDTHLNVYDLYELQLPAELVTLSGCTTGLQLAAAGDELLGISRGLFCAGARSLLLTLWEVQDETTSRFMQNFYTRRLAGAELPVAVRDAMLELRSTHAHPYYWAPFALMGGIRTS